MTEKFVLSEAEKDYMIKHSKFVHLIRDVSNPSEEEWTKAKNELMEASDKLKKYYAEVLFNK